MTIGGLRCLEIGPGDCPLEGGWDKIDVVLPTGVAFGQQVNGETWYNGEWGKEVLPFKNASYDLIFASHVIEHIPWYQTMDALTEAYRILAPNGDLEIWTLDFKVIVEAYLEKRWVRDWDCAGRVRNWMHSIAGHVFAYEKHGSQFNWHRALFDVEYMVQCLQEAGFRQVARLEKSRGHDHGPANMGFRATK